MLKSITLLVFILSFLGCQGTVPKITAYPETAEKTVTETYHGVKVEDSFRWLEDTKAKDVQDWSKKQTKLSRSYLSKLPEHRSFSSKLSKILSAQDTSYFSLMPLKKGFLFMKKNPSAKQGILVYADSIEDLKKQRVLVNPNKIDKTGATTITKVTPSPSGKYVAVVFSQAGKEVGDTVFYNVETGEKLKDRITKTYGPTAGGSLVWLSDEEVLHTRYPHEGERAQKDEFFYQNLYRYKLGSNKSTYELGKGLPKISSIVVKKAPDSKKVLATVQYGDSGRFSYYLRFKNGRWKKIISEKYEVKEAFFGYGDQLFLISYKRASKGKLLKLNAKNPKISKAKIVVKEQKEPLVSDFYSGGVSIALKKHIVLQYQLGGPSEFRIFDYNGKSIELPKAESAVRRVGSFKAKKDDDGFYFNSNSYVEPYFYYDFSFKTKTAVKTKIGQYTKVKFDGVKVVREFATSKDGTQVPVNIMFPKGYKKGEQRPLILTGYGGYGVNLTPRFNASNSVWLDKGGIYVVANIRGGGEYGKEWHEEGRLTKKQNVFDDFYAASRYLIEAGYTTQDQMGIIGGSNGGLLMGAVMTQHPGDFKAVVAMVGIYDSLRSELSPNGAFNIPEFGTVKKKDEFKALYAYSPYHRAQKADYPAVLITTGINDNRVDPMHSLKMAAMLQKQNKSENPILLKVSLDSGHGQGDSVDIRVKKLADVFSFFEYQLAQKNTEKK